MPTASVSTVQRTGCTALESFMKHRPCFFPARPGRKHTRPFAHRFPGRDTVSVARREAVAALDLVVGSKG